MLIAIFASYTALDLANSITVSKGRAKFAWLSGGSLAMGVGIWSMHFIAMLAFSLPGILISYDVPLLILSIIVAIIASAITLAVVSGKARGLFGYITASLFMGAAIAGMHYIGIASMRMATITHWNMTLVYASIAIAIIASFVALQLAFRLRFDVSKRGFLYRGAGGVIMGFAISGMHFTAMAAMSFSPTVPTPIQTENLLATEGLAVIVIGATLLILGIALTGSIVDRALSRRIAMTEQMTRILESITDAFFNVDLNWRFTYINKVAAATFERLTGKTVMDLIGRNLWEEIPQFEGSKFENVCRKAMTNNSTERLEEFIPNRHIWIESQIYSYPEGLSVYFRDVTSRKTNEEALEEAVRSRDNFLSIASHELKTPLTSIKLQAQMLKKMVTVKDAPLDETKVNKLLDQTVKGVERLSRLVDDMLDISRISRGKLSLSLEEFDLSELTTDVVDRLCPLLKEVSCEVNVKANEKITGKWDKFRIEQVLTNLLTNAARYGAGKPVHVTLQKEGNQAKLSVRDEGRGIEKENHEKIFQRFERVDKNKEISGIGLGLFIARQIVEMHKGTIKVESELGKGAEFIVFLPLEHLP